MPKQIDEPSPPSSIGYLSEDEDEDGQTKPKPPKKVDTNAYLYEKGKNIDAGSGESKKICTYSYIDSKFMQKREFNEAPFPQYLSYDKLLKNE